jgi:hypothetical protein
LQVLFFQQKFQAQRALLIIRVDLPAITHYALDVTIVLTYRYHARFLHILIRTLVAVLLAVISSIRARLVVGMAVQILALVIIKLVVEAAVTLLTKIVALVQHVQIYAQSIHLVVLEALARRQQLIALVLNIVQVAVAPLVIVLLILVLELVAQELMVAYGETIIAAQVVVPILITI